LRPHSLCSSFSFSYSLAPLLTVHLCSLLLTPAFSRRHTALLLPCTHSHALTSHLSFLRSFFSRCTALSALPLPLLSLSTQVPAHLPHLHLHHYHLPPAATHLLSLLHLFSCLLLLGPAHTCHTASPLTGFHHTATLGALHTCTACTACTLPAWVTTSHWIYLPAPAHHLRCLFSFHTTGCTLCTASHSFFSYHSLSCHCSFHLCLSVCTAPLHFPTHFSCTLTVSCTLLFASALSGFLHLLTLPLLSILSPTLVPPAPQDRLSSAHHTWTGSHLHHLSTHSLHHILPLPLSHLGWFYSLHPLVPYHCISHTTHCLVPHLLHCTTSWVLIFTCTLGDGCRCSGHTGSPGCSVGSSYWPHLGEISCTLHSPHLHLPPHTLPPHHTAPTCLLLPHLHTTPLTHTPLGWFSWVSPVSFPGFIPTLLTCTAALHCYHFTHHLHLHPWATTTPSHFDLPTFGLFISPHTPTTLTRFLPPFTTWVLPAHTLHCTPAQHSLPW